MLDKSLLITIVVLIALASLATVSGLHNWEIGAVAVALMGFTFLTLLEASKGKTSHLHQPIEDQPCGWLGIKIG